MLVRDYMSTSIVTVLEKSSLQNALRVMHQHKIQRLPIINKADELVGIVTERDLLYALPVPVTALGSWGANPDFSGTPIQDFMNKSLITVTPEATIDEAVRKMLKYTIGGLPVVDPDAHLIGMLTKTDILKAFLDRHHNRSDMDIFLIPEMYYA